MSKHIKSMVKAASACLLGLAGAFAMVPAAQAAPIELCLAIDSSGTIDDTEWQLQIDAYRNALLDPTIVPQDGTVAVSIVTFSTDTLVSLGLTDITAATAGNGGALKSTLDALYATRPFNGQTAIGDAILRCIGTFSANNPGAKRIIDVSTDGENNEGVNPVITAANAFSAKEVHAINLIGVGDLINEAELNSIAQPQPANAVGAGDGFVTIAESWEDFTPTLQAKIQAEIVVTSNLVVTKTNNADSVAPGADTIYTVTITNTGAAAATNVSWTDVSLGLNITDISTNTASDGSVAGSCNLGGCTGITVAAGGGSVSYRVTATVTGSPDTDAENTATVTGGGNCGTAPVPSASCTATDRDPIREPDAPPPPPPQQVTPVPTMTEWGLMLLTALLTALAWLVRLRSLM
ncbi:DUF1194 domain-containing protein [Ottowia sp.]|uniref:DUF1194 domain-containing protein n=1 Tax=Ottowia sp. TaxID=1898956 RepID=UPI0025CED353|nr:DUF1194 domain-containing protein [Ottowia sp.]MBK6746018.1 DUF1194 domain-containing protein [Ottowia sp.]